MRQVVQCVIALMNIKMISESVFLPCRICSRYESFDSNASPAAEWERTLAAASLGLDFMGSVALFDNHGGFR
jgi:hypothetical protein